MSRHTMRILKSACAAILLLAAPARAQAPEPLFGPNQAVPRDYRVWSLFLICNPEWLLEGRASDLATLYRQFEAFGHSIGPENAAVWFWKTEDSGALYRDTPLADLLDVSRSATYCAKYRLLPSEGPHVLVTTSHPDDPPGDYSVVKLNGLKAADIGSLLARLADQVLVTGLDQEELDSETAWRLFQDAAERVLAAGIGWIDRVSFAIDTKFFKLEVEGGR
jgi:hypothetical protein